MVVEKSAQYVIHGYTCYIIYERWVDHLQCSVVIPVNHVCSGTPISELGSIVVPGGITFSGPVGDEWRIGFNCRLSSSGTCMGYVKQELTSLIEQLIELERVKNEGVIMSNQHTQQFNKEMPSINDKYGHKLDYSEQGFMCSIIQSEDNLTTFYGYVRLDNNHPLWAKSASLLSKMLCHPIYQVELVATGYWMGFRATGVTLNGMEEKVSCLIREITKFGPSVLSCN